MIGSDNKYNAIICHLTTVHQPFDTRIFYKECKTLLKAGYEVYLVASHDKDEQKEGVNIVSLPQAKNRFERMVKKTRLAYKKALEIDAQIYHFHDPELIPVGLLLEWRGKKVIYDVHEDVPKQILSKTYLPKFIRPLLSKLIEKIEYLASKKFDYIITATPFIKDRFLKNNVNTIDVQNMPILEEFIDIQHNWSYKEKAVCYVGGITKIRGIFEMLDAIKLLPEINLYLAGPLEYQNFIDDIKKSENTKFLGFLNRQELKQLFYNCICGLVLFHPEKNHINSQPNKLFEYMSAGLPVIASNFQSWKNIVESNNCGICVDPLNPKDIAEAIKYLVDNPDIARKMGENGRKAVLEKYNWENEAKKLLNVYEKLHS